MRSEPSAGELRLTDGATGRTLVVRPRRLILAGFTGRDQEEVRRHVDELRAQGIPAPASVPELYTLAPNSIQVGGHLAAGEGWSSGEIEFVLFETASPSPLPSPPGREGRVSGAAGLYVGIGSDHTDREIERTSFVAAKQAFPKIVGQRIWPMTHLAHHWDDLTLHSWITCDDGRRQPYQASSLSAIMMPGDLLGLVAKADRVADLVLFSGTVPAIEPPPRSGPCRFDGELVAPDGRTLATCAYEYEAGPR